MSNRPHRSICDAGTGPFSINCTRMMRMPGKPEFFEVRSEWRRWVANTVVAVFLMLLFTACERGPRVRISDANGASKAIVQVEIADTAAARELGLMYRQHLGKDAGMLFIFKQPQQLTFWMKNTEIPLDMIFAGADGIVVGIIANAEPFSERQLSVDGDSQYVLEVNGGFAQRHEIRPGDRLQFLGFTPSAEN
jgi:uncharacterized membrane protein (UPF0127 family)